MLDVLDCVAVGTAATDQSEVAPTSTVLLHRQERQERSKTLVSEESLEIKSVWLPFFPAPCKQGAPHEQFLFHVPRGTAGA